MNFLTFKVDGVQIDEFEYTGDPGWREIIIGRFEVSDFYNFPTPEQLAIPTTPGDHAFSIECTIYYSGAVEAGVLEASELPYYEVYLEDSHTVTVECEETELTASIVHGGGDVDIYTPGSWIIDVDVTNGELVWIKVWLRNTEDPVGSTNPEHYYYIPYLNLEQPGGEYLAFESGTTEFDAMFNLWSGDTTYFGEEVDLPAKEGKYYLQTQIRYKDQDGDSWNYKWTASEQVMVEDETGPVIDVEYVLEYGVVNTWNPGDWDISITEDDPQSHLFRVDVFMRCRSDPWVSGDNYATYYYVPYTETGIRFDYEDEIDEFNSMISLWGDGTPRFVLGDPRYDPDPDLPAIEGEYYLVIRAWSKNSLGHNIYSSMWYSDSPKVLLEERDVGELEHGVFETDCWRNPGENRKNAMFDKLVELQELIDAEEYQDVYDKLLHDVKPKLTGLKTDETETAWNGGKKSGIFENPWVTCPEQQEILRVSCNNLLVELNPPLITLIYEQCGMQVYYEGDVISIETDGDIICTVTAGGKIVMQWSDEVTYVEQIYYYNDPDFLAEYGPETPPEFPVMHQATSGEYDAKFRVAFYDTSFHSHNQWIRFDVI
jgi:hypothetical protein